MRHAAELHEGMAPEVIEKDFWVCWTLGRLFGSPETGKKLLFKGGTSLSKVFGLIERFSEDVDLILDWREVTQDDPTATRSVTKQDSFNKTLMTQAHTYLRNTFLPEVQNLVAGTCNAEIEENPEIVKVTYPVAFPSSYLKPEIRLEVGPLASWTPNAVYEVRPYVADALPDHFERPSCHVHAIKAERTFWEKITILHHEAHRPAGNEQPPGYSRHYYDVYRIAQTPIKGRALADLDLLRAVVTFKDKFYHRGWARYDLATPGTMKLVPPDHIMRAVERDYDQMRFMIFGRRPEFQEIMDSIRALEIEINAL